ncbi:hypothetical protein F5Y11DRAFT_366391 [Daldinia sp. FL1419]|nr:hypothetical protein F5Y11DRAFT_366391 [Daldinia sp. FL1419]
MDKDDIAIIGLSFKLPQGAEDESSLWDILEQRKNLMTEWPKSRLNIDSFYNKLRSRGGHFLKDDPALFDAPFFSITKKEAAAMDPQQRIALETSYRAFENAGLPMEYLKGTNTAVFGASMLGDYLAMLSRDPENYPRTSITGNSPNNVPNRVSWYFDLLGPSVHVDTACSSSTVAIDLACNTLRKGDAAMALVTSSSLMLGPDASLMLANMEFTSPDSFDHRANGYGRGEGAAAVVLKPIADAVRDGNLIRAVIRSTGTNQDGHTPSFTAPCLQSQESLIRQVYEKANLSPHKTRYVEAHGTGTPVGDPIEMKAIGNTLGKYRSQEEPLYVGSIKANIGHLEPASGLAGIVKTIMILEKGVIPPNALFERINPEIDAESYNLVVPTECVDWPDEGLRRVSVCSFGFGGTNAHVILDDAYNYLRERGLTGNHCTIPSPSTLSSTQLRYAPIEQAPQSPPYPRLLVWSADNEKSLKSMINDYQHFYQTQVLGHEEKVDRLVHTLAHHRSRMLWRAFGLVNFKDQSKAIDVSKPVRTSSETGLAFVFTGQGVQYAGMGNELQQYQIYNETLQQLDKIYADLGSKWSLFDELEHRRHIHEPEYSQPLCTALQIALIELLRSFNLVPSVVVGHSSGETAAAYCTGALTKESACKISYYRGQLAGKLMKKSSQMNAMLSVNLPEGEVQDYLRKVNPTYLSGVIYVSCINSPTNCTLSGAEYAIDDIQRQLNEDHIFSHKFNVGIAYHSPFMTEVASEYGLLMGTLENNYSNNNQMPIPMISSVTGQVVSPRVLSTAQYWVENLTLKVRFSEAIEELLRFSHAPENGISPVLDLVEVGPHCAMRRPIQDILSSLSGRKTQVRYSSVLYKSKSCLQSTVELAGRLFCYGYPVSITAACPQLTKKEMSPILANCPEYPFDHSRNYWWESRLSRDLRLMKDPQSNILGSRSIDWNPLEPRWRNTISLETMPWMADHIVSDTIVFPAAGMLLMAIEAVEQTRPGHRKSTGYYIKEAEFLNPIILKATADDRVETVLQLRPIRNYHEKDSVWSDIRIYSNSGSEWAECFRTKIEAHYESPTSEVDGGVEDQLAAEEIVCDYDLTRASSTKRIDAHSFYMHFKRNGITYGDSFQLVDDIHWDGSRKAVAKLDIASPNVKATGLTHPGVLDAAMQLLLVPISAGLSESSPTLVPKKLEGAWFSTANWQYPDTSSLHCMAVVKPDNIKQAVEGSITIISHGDLPVCTIKKLVLASVSNRDAKDLTATKLLYGIEWKPQLSLLDSKSLQASCEADKSKLPGEDLVGFHQNLNSTLRLVASHVVQWLHRIDRKTIPDSLQRYVEWMEIHVKSSNHGYHNLTEEDLERRLQQLEDQRPSWMIFPVMARNIKAILVGQVDPLRIAFDSGLAEAFYVELLDRVCDNRLRNFLELACHENPSIRIFEIGAGTGAMTQHVLSVLLDLEKDRGSRFIEYVYTDISASFFEQAKDRFNDDRVIFRTYNAERDPADQGFSEGAYDLVVAGSVLHATSELSVTLRNTKRLLKPGGCLIVAETTRPDLVSTNFCFGTLPGWWPKDHWRHSCPVITEDQWDEQLRKNGFSGCDVLIKDNDDKDCHAVSLMISTAETRPSNPLPSSEILLVIDGSSSTQGLIANKLTESVLKSFSKAMRTVSLDNLHTTSIGDNDILIFLVETERPCLETTSKTSFEVLKDMINRSNNLLWVTCASIREKGFPFYHISQGLLRAVRSEATEKHIVSLIFESANVTTLDCVEIITRIFKASFVSSSPELEYLVRDGKITTGRLFQENALDSTIQSLVRPRLSNEPLFSDAAVKLTQRIPGTLNTFEFTEDKTSESDLGPHEVEIEGKNWGLSFRDIFIAIGRLQEDSFGSECSGIVTRVGSDCSTISPGDRVCMISENAMRTHPRAAVANVAKIPDAISSETATAILGPGITAYHCLAEVARMRPGEKVLIHSASGATGQMAIWVSKLLRAEIFATVGFDEKKQFLIDEFGIPADHIFYSRDTSFARGVLRITRGRGVDVVLNSLAGDGLKASWNCIAPYGRFIEIGKADIAANSSLPMANFAKNVSFTAVDIHHLILSNPEATASLISKIMELALQGMIQCPKPLHIIPVSNIEQAFRQLQSGRSPGRVLISLSHSDIVPKRLPYRPKWKFDTNASYLIAGGLGGLGRLAIRWMASRGAKHLILPSRSGASSQAASDVLTELRGQGINVVAPKCDVSSADSVTAMLQDCAHRKVPPVKGCINATMDLQDAVFESMTHEQWERTMRSKAQASWNLHELLPQSLDFFVLLSSLAGIYGSAVQSNYAAGCTFQDALAYYRTANGEKAISFDIGWMLNSGVIAETERYEHLRRQIGDMGQIQDEELLALLELYCDPTLPVLSPPNSQLLVGCLTPSDLIAQGRQPVERMRRPLFAAFQRARGQGASNSKDQSATNIAAMYRQATGQEERQDLITYAIARKLSDALAIDPDDIKMEKSLSDYGVDSLMAVELRNWINSDLQANVAVFEIMGGRRIIEVANLILEKSLIGVSAEKEENADMDEARS